MPDIKKYKKKDQKKWMRDCLHQTLHMERKKREQGIAQCMNIFRQHFKKSAHSIINRFLNRSAVDKSEAECPNCKHRFNYDSVPEAGMGYVKCPKCERPVHQGNIIKNASVKEDLTNAENQENPSVFLGGLCDDTSWRGQLKQEFGKQLFFIDPYDPDWDPASNIYDELTGLMKADNVIFYKGGDGSNKEKEFMDQIGKEYADFDDMDKLKMHLKGLIAADKSIVWIKPNFSKEADEYFDNRYTKTYLAGIGVNFPTKESLYAFLSQGSFKDMTREELLASEHDNLTLNPDEFESDLQSSEYAASYRSMESTLKDSGSIKLEAPILIKAHGKYYGFSGKRRTNLAFNNGLPARFWVVYAHYAKQAAYPDHPDDLVISKSELLEGSHEIHEIDVWNYYTNGVVNKMLPELRGRDLFIGMKLKQQMGKKPLYIRHPYDKKTEYIRISNLKDFSEYRSGRTVEVHVTMPAMCPYYVVDFDAVSDWKKTKEITAEIADKLDKLPEVKSVEIRYSGKRGFHALGWLKKSIPIDQARDKIKEWLKEAFKDHKDVVVGESPVGSKGALGISPMKLNGGQVALWSLRVTGLCCVEVPRAQLMGFDRSDATIDKVYKKLTRKTFVWNNKTEQKKTAARIIARFLARD